MELVLKKSFRDKIIIAMIFIAIFNFIQPYTAVHAKDSVGGVLYEPVQALVLALFDAVNWGVHKLVVGSDDTMITVAQDKGGFGFWVAWIATAVVTVVGVALTIVTAGTFAGAFIGLALTGAAAYNTYTHLAPDTLNLPIYSVSPYEIFSNKIGMMGVNFFDPDTEMELMELKGSKLEKVKDDRAEHMPTFALRELISNWYIAFRTMALVGLLSVLAYLGIKIITTSSAGEKAKFKENLTNWMTAMCMLFIMHYGMVILLHITDILTNIMVPEKEFYNLNLTTTKDGIGEDEDPYMLTLKDQDPVEITNWPVNLMGYMRVQAQMEYGVFSEIAYTIMYGVLVIYTIMFLFVYFKRVIYMAFLTMIAPLIALTYPIDKAGDGKAQAFDAWVKEYIYNLIIQPVHLLLYVVLVGASADLAMKNPIFALVAIGFLLPAEKIIRSFFGFKNEKTMGGVNSALGGAMFMKGIQSLTKVAGAGAKAVGKVAKEDGGSDNSSSDGGSNIRVASDNAGINAADTLAEHNNGGEGRRGINNSEQFGNQNQNQNQNQFDNLDDLRLDGDESGMSERDRRAEMMNKIENDEDRQNYLDHERYRNDLQSDIDYMKESGEDPENYQALQDEIDYHQSEMDAIDDKYNLSGQNSDNLVSNENSGLSESYNGGNSNIRMTSGEAASRRNELAKKYLNKKRLNRNAKIALRTAKAVGKVGLKATGAAAGLSVGIAAGLASDDYSNVLSFGGIGAGIGATAVPSVATAAINAPKNIYNKSKKAKAKATEEALYESGSAEEIRSYMNEKADKAFMKDEEVKRQYAMNRPEGMTRDEAMKTAISYRDQGITDNKVILEAMKIDGYGDAGSKQRIALAKAATKCKTERSIKAFEKQLAERGVPAEQIKKTTNDIRMIRGMD